MDLLPEIPFGGSAAPVPTYRVFIAGGSYAGLSTAVNLLDLGRGLSPRMASERYKHHNGMELVNWEITIADERDGFYHLIGSPRALADTNYANKTWIPFKEIPALESPQIKIVHGSVASVDCASRTAITIEKATGTVTMHYYDYFVAATGLRRVWPVVPQAQTKKQFLTEVHEHVHSVVNATHGIVVVGGGAVGVGMAAELKKLRPHIAVTLVHSRDRLLSSEGLRDECKDKIRDLLREGGVEVLLGHRMRNAKNISPRNIAGRESPRYKLEFTNGESLYASAVFMAVSTSMSTARSYLPWSVLDEQGFVQIRSNALFPPGIANADQHFCAGDIAKWPGIKRRGYAMHMGHCVAHNIHQLAMQRFTGQEAVLETLSELAPMMSLAIGHNAISSGPKGTIWGENVLERYFEDDLGFGISWDWLGLHGINKQEPDD
ncbi:hypothetical protein E4U21_007439 [Claviceps maximensis]|nr:hypothetical protein E4U21_007439 [Claviceps maximensis]